MIQTNKTHLNNVAIHESTDNRATHASSGADAGALHVRCFSDILIRRLLIERAKRRRERILKVLRALSKSLLRKNGDSCDSRPARLLSSY